MKKQSDKRDIRYRQFAGGYAQVEDTELRALLEGYRQGLFRRNEVRVYAGQLEMAALHKESKVSLFRIVNCQSNRKGNRRLSEGEIQTAVEKLDQLLPVIAAEFEANEHAGEKQAKLKPVARKVLRHIARGGATTVEALLCFAYFLRRIPQRKPMQRLKPNEFYARLTYAEFESWTGVHRATASRILQRLIDRGYVNTQPVSKQNENCYGQLFIDGAMISLIRPRQASRRRKARSGHPQPPAALSREKRSTPPQDLINSPTEKRSTLINGNPKTGIQKEKGLALRLREGHFGCHGDPDLQRIALRAAQMAENVLEQAA